MKKLYDKYKREIWVGVVVSIITTFIIKLGDWIVSVAPLVESTVFKTISNSLYSLAATYSDNHLLKILFVGSFGILVGMFSNAIIKGIKIYKSTRFLEKRIKNLSDFQINDLNDTFTKTPHEQLGQSSEESVHDLIKSGKSLGKRAILAILIIVFICIIIEFFFMTPMSLSNKFQQDIIKIAPYVEESEITQLKSDWVCMRSKDDYDNIYQFIDTIKSTYSLPD